MSRACSRARRRGDLGARSGTARQAGRRARRPVRAHGAVRGILVGTLDLAGPDVMRRLDAARRLGKHGARRARRPGRDRARLDRVRRGARPGEHLAFYRTMLKAAKPGIADVSVTPGDHEPGRRCDAERHVMAFVRLAAAPWGVALGGTDSETYAPAHRLRRTLLLAGGELARRALAAHPARRPPPRPPVRGLTRAAEEMASGNLERTVSVSEGGEIGVLAESLETMRAQLKDSLETVRRWGEELELKVADRTAELNARNRQLAAVSAILTAANETHDLEGMLAALPRRRARADRRRTPRRCGCSTTAAARPRRRVARGDLDRLPLPHAAATASASRPPPTARPLYLDRRERERLHPGCAVAAEALAVLPLRGPSGVLGVLTLGRRHGELPTPEERPILTAICDQIAVAVENTRLAAELRRLEARHEVQRMRSELISAVSHELRTPLGFIKSYATTLLREDTPIEPATRRHFLEIIDEETEKLEHMIDELLDASRLQAGPPADRAQAGRSSARSSPARSTRPGRRSKRAATTVALRLPGERRHSSSRTRSGSSRCSTTCSRTPPATPTPARRSRSASLAEDGHALVSVTDRGDGIAAAELEQIFEPFYRGRSAKQRGIRGAGLGLAICRGIVEAHGGRIWAESLEGSATTFLLTLPLAETA